MADAPGAPARGADREGVRLVQHVGGGRKRGDGGDKSTLRRPVPRAERPQQLMMLMIDVVRC